MLSMIPGLGELMSAEDAVKAFREAQRLDALGKLDEALDKRGDAALNAVGAIPFIGRITKAPRIARKFKRFFAETRVGQLEPENPRSFSISRITDRKIISQFDQPTCGTASCAMTLTILTGASPDIKAINEAAKLTDDGVRLSRLTAVMKENGVIQARYRTRISVDEVEGAVAGNRPAIVHLSLDRGDHGVVVDGFAIRNGKKFVAVLDPAGKTVNKPGRAYLVPIEEFTERFTGNAILTNPIRRRRP
jgi:filamentous hemagglutinin